MNSERIMEHLAFANRSAPNAERLLNESEGAKPVETAVRALQERRCELFEGGLGI
jgi:hypothetical protein